jgi:hypothetical protein
MRNALFYTTLAFAAANVMSGLLANQVIWLDSLNDEKLFEVRLVLIIGMPILLMVSWLRLRITSATNMLGLSLQIAGQAALFCAPYLWIYNHA